MIKDDLSSGTHHTALSDDLSMDEILASIRRIISEEEKNFQRQQKAPEKQSSGHAADSREERPAQDASQSLSSQATRDRSHFGQRANPPQAEKETAHFDDELVYEDVSEHVKQVRNEVQQTQNSYTQPQAQQFQAPQQKLSDAELLKLTNVKSDDIPQFLKQFHQEQMQQRQYLAQNSAQMPTSRTERDESYSDNFKKANYDFSQKPGFNDDPAILNLTQALSPEGNVHNLKNGKQDDIAYIKKASYTDELLAEFPNYMKTNYAAAIEAEKPVATQQQKEAYFADISDAANNAAETKIPGNSSLELLITQAVRPMLKEWIDTNLQTIVERAVREELRRRI